MTIDEKWQAMESAPKDERILVYSPSYKEQFVVFLGINPEDGDEKWVIARGEYVTFICKDPIAWQPLPQPPKGNSHE